MRELNCENVNSFLGLNQGVTGVSLLWAYCHKGSVYDIIGNDDIALDFNFSMSFAEDIARVGTRRFIFQSVYIHTYIHINLILGVIVYKHCFSVDVM